MSTAPKKTFKLTIDRDASPPQIDVEDLTGQHPPVTLNPGAELPYYLAVDHAEDAHAELAIRLASRDEQPFDPDVTRDRDVLTVEAATSDQTFGTQDDTRYILTLRNKSQYYIAEDIHVTAAVASSAHDLITLPDGNAALIILPREQHVSCIDPGKDKQVVFMAIARGTQPGLYPVDVTVAYRLIYWDGRHAQATFRQELPVQGPDHCFDIPDDLGAPVPMPRQPFAQRSHVMSEQHRPVFFAPSAPRVQHRVLKPIRLRIALSGGGHLEVSYRLTKGNHPDPEHCHCCYGVNPDSKSVESYFSTQDTAALEVTLHNDSPHHLKHVHLTDVQLATACDDGSAGPVADKKLPDGNLLFEIVPSDIYYGHLGPDAKQTKYLSLITRGVVPGNYFVQMEAHYDIERCRIQLDLGLTVNPD
jgi:hypothetical protein